MVGCLVNIKRILNRKRFCFVYSLYSERHRSGEGDETIVHILSYINKCFAGGNNYCKITCVFSCFVHRHWHCFHSNIHAHRIIKDSLVLSYPSSLSLSLKKICFCHYFNCSTCWMFSRFVKRNQAFKPWVRLHVHNKLSCLLSRK